MGGFFSAPKAPPAPPPLPPQPDLEDTARKERLAQVEANRRGRRALIATSDKGALQSKDETSAPNRKRLLGE